MTRVLRRPEEVSAFAATLAREGRTCGFVPTMGALHEGHRALVRRSRAENDATVVSVYVNPLQFGPHEDFSRYPRPFEKDVEACAAEGADVVFAPDTETMRPEGFATQVRVAGVTDTFEGALRPGHFDGVATIVAILLQVVRPTRAYFGQKDFQQTVVVRRMVRDLRIPVSLVIHPIVRDTDGLALSSRNVYLSADDRRHALLLPRSLLAAESRVAAGERDGAVLRAAMHEGMRSSRADVTVDYAEVVHPETLAVLPRIEDHGVLLAVLRVGPVRLLDNRVVTVPGRTPWSPQ